MLNIIITIAVALLTAELIGYFLHALMHSNKIEFLSKSHMIHHLVIYGPKQPFRTEKYQTSLIDGRPGIDGIGLEWLLPIAIIITTMSLILWLLRIPLELSLIFIGTGLVWEFIMFNYMHDSMHLEHFWMNKNRLLGKWYKGAQLKHEIHHLEIDDQGRMCSNYGICFFFFDRLFGSYVNKFNEFNEAGFEKAKTRYAYIYKLLKERAPLE